MSICSQQHDLYHIDLKTAFLQGEAYDECRDVICQLPAEAGYPPYIAARLKRPAYGLNDAPRRWWNIIDKALRSYGMVPTRADRCCYVLHSKSTKRAEANNTASDDSRKRAEAAKLLKSYDKVKAKDKLNMDLLDKAIDLLTDPIYGSPSKKPARMRSPVPTCRRPLHGRRR